MGPVGITEGSTWRLAAQDHAEEATMDRQLHPAVVFDKSKLPELIHELADPRPGAVYHLRQAFLMDAGKYSFGSTFLVKMSQR
jgi:hypothetical protein